MRFSYLKYFLIISIISPLASLGQAKTETWDLSLLPAQKQTEIETKFLQQNEKDISRLSEEIIQFLHKDPAVKRVQILKDGKTYKVAPTKSQLIESIEWGGNKAFSKSELRELLALKEGDLFNSDLLIEAGERVRQAYQDSGFLNATVDISYPENQKGQIELKISIKENRQTLIKDIIIRSGNPDLNKRLSRALRTFRNEALSNNTLTEIQNLCRDWLSNEAFFKSDIGNQEITFSKNDSEATVALTIDKVESYNVQFRGHSFFSTGKLKSLVNFDDFYTANPLVGNDMATIIREAYLRKGFARVEVTSQELPSDRPFTKKVIININEGNRIRIEGVNISGRFSRPEKYYEDFVLNHSTELIADGYYNREEIDIGVQSLVLQLQNEGYLTAKVISSRVQYSKEKDRVTFFLNLDEGTQTFVEEISFVGNTSYRPDQLKKLTALKEGEPLKLSDIEASVHAIKTFYLENGFIDMKILNEGNDLVLYNSNNTKAALHYKIQEGPQVRVASIAIEGNTFTKDNVIHRELEVQEGELLTPSKIEESISRLQRTGYFNTVDIKTLEEKTSVANRTLIVKVSERDPGVLIFGAGATNERTLTLRGYTSIAYRNLWGTGRGVSLRLEGNYNVADIKYLESKVTAGYLEPYLFNSRVRGRLNLTRSSLVTNYEIGQVTEVRQQTWSVEKEFNKHILGIYDIYSLATVHDFGLDDRYIFPSSTLDIASTGPTLDVDYRDNPFNPTTGTFTRLRGEYASPDLGSSQEIEYWKATASFTHYWRLNKRPLIWSSDATPMVWANNLQLGYLQNLSPDGGVPYDKKGFILGGRTTVRGFEAGTSEVFPNAEELGTDKYTLLTESKMFLVKSELRFPIYGSFGGAVFYDGGSVLISGLNFKDPYRDSAGFGFRYNTPVGPVNLEFAWKLDQKVGEDPWKFHLSIGTF